MHATDPSHEEWHPTAFIPAELTSAIHAFGDFLDEIRTGATADAAASVPTPAAAATIVAHFERLWRGAGMDASLGLARATPDHVQFRDALGRFLYESPHLAYCLSKPRGYAGDFLMMEAVCDQAVRAERPLGQWLERWFFAEFPPYRAVRNRVAMMADILAAEWHRGARRALSVACGAAPELRALPRATRYDRIDLLDQDPGALEQAVARLAAGADALTPADLGVVPHVASVRSLLRGTALSDSGSYDVIYSMGLFDYLADRPARDLVATLWRRLNPGGVLLIGNFHGHHWARYVMEAVMDWFLIYRDPPALRALAQGLPDVRDVRVLTEDQQLLLLMSVRKA